MGGVVAKPLRPPPGHTTSILQKAEVRIINGTVCKRLMSDEVTEGMLCAGILKGGVDACQVTHTSIPPVE